MRLGARVSLLSFYFVDKWARDWNELFQLVLSRMQFGPAAAESGSFRIFWNLGGNISVVSCVRVEL